MHVKLIKHNTTTKTLGPQAARLVVELNERGARAFTLADVERITGVGPASARSFTAALVRRGVATRVKPGLFTLVPYELGEQPAYLGDPYTLVESLVQGAPWYISHASALSLHAMTTQPEFVVRVTTPKAMRPLLTHGQRFTFIRCKFEDVWGTTDVWVGGRTVGASDRERTVIDCLKQPEHCGGLTEAARGLWMAQSRIDPGTLVDYAIRLENGAVIRRLGYLMDTYGIGTGADLDRLRTRLTATYALADPIFEPEGRFLSKWRLRLNVTPDELR
jgi:predicted transcriptional regulator of viral defense system